MSIKKKTRGSEPFHNHDGKAPAIKLPPAATISAAIKGDPKAKVAIAHWRRRHALFADPAQLPPKLSALIDRIEAEQLERYRRERPPENPRGAAR
jgi:hypothetical protein